MTRVLLATFQLCPDGEPGGGLLVDALAERGVEARWAVWDDPDVDWATADLVAVRATWDYTRRLEEFLAWARHTHALTPVLNGPETFAWNADKAYLLELAEVLPVVPTELLDETTLIAGLGAATARHGEVVIKPRLGASGIGVVVVDRVLDPRLQLLVRGPWVVQPLVDSVRTVGETSVYVFGGVARTQVDKLPPGAGSPEIRVHEAYGGASRAVALRPDAAALAQEAVAVSGRLLGADPAYARVDLLELDGRLVVSELELIEPGLYLEEEPANAVLRRGHRRASRPHDARPGSRPSSRPGSRRGLTFLHSTWSSAKHETGSLLRRVPMTSGSVR